MESFLKVIAIIITIVIVLSIYPALAWGWFIRPIFWLAYFLGIMVDLWCIKRLKKMQMGKNK